jgi:alpha-mannosidase
VIYSLYKGLPQIYIDVAVNWAENRKILKMEIHPAGARAPVLTMQAPGGAVKRRADGRELPLHQWVWLSTHGVGVAVVQDGAFACDYATGRLRLTLVRSSLYGYHDPTTLGPADPQHPTDQGEHQFRVCLSPEQNLDVERLERLADAFQELYLIIREGRHT